MPARTAAKTSQIAGRPAELPLCRFHIVPQGQQGRPADPQIPRLQNRQSGGAQQGATQWEPAAPAALPGHRRQQAPAPGVGQGQGGKGGQPPAEHRDQKQGGPQAPVRPLRLTPQPEGKQQQQPAALHRKGPHMGVRHDLQLPLPALVGGQGVAHIAEAVQMDPPSDQQGDGGHPRRPQQLPQPKGSCQPGPQQQSAAHRQPHQREGVQGVPPGPALPVQRGHRDAGVQGEGHAHGPQNRHTSPPFQWTGSPQTSSVTRSARAARSRWRRASRSR